MNHKKMNKYYFEHDFINFSDYVKSFHTIKKTYSAGQVISSQAETLNSGYYIESGIMKLSIGISDESEKTLTLFGPGSIFPLGIDEHHYSLEYAIEESAFTDVVAYEFNFLELRNMFLKNSDFALKMIEHYCDFTSFLFYEISILSSFDSLIKIAAILNSLADTSLCKNNRLSFSQSDIAVLAGSSKIQTARVYKFLKEADIIDVGRNSITIKDYDKLQELISFDEYCE